MKDKTLEELISLFEEVVVELQTRRYFEYIANIGKWGKNIPNPECPEKFPSAGMTVPIEGMEEILAAIDENKAYLEKYPQFGAYSNIRISKEDLFRNEHLAAQLWNETVNSNQ